MLDKQLFSHYSIDIYGLIWDRLTEFNFSKQTKLPDDVLCFLEQGSIRKYVSDNDEVEPKETSIDFYLDGDIFTAKTEKLLDCPVIYEAISTGRLWYVSMDVVREMFNASQLCGAVQRVFMEEKLREKAFREIQLLRSTPQEVYDYLLKNKPRFIQHIPLKYLASYIGVTPQALSRIRKRIN